MNQPVDLERERGTEGERGSLTSLNDAQRGVVQARLELSQSLLQASQAAVQVATHVYRRSKPLLLLAIALGGVLVVMLLVQRRPAPTLWLGAGRKSSLVLKPAKRRPSLLLRGLSLVAGALARRLVAKMLQPAPGGTGPAPIEHS